MRVVAAAINSTALYVQGSLRTTPEQKWWASMLPTFAVVVIAVTLAATVLLLPKVLKGGLTGGAMLRQLFAPANNDISEPAAEPLESLDDGTLPGMAPTWASMDLGIFDEYDEPGEPSGGVTTP